MTILSTLAFLPSGSSFIARVLSERGGSGLDNLYETSEVESDVHRNDLDLGVSNEAELDLEGTRLDE